LKELNPRATELVRVHTAASNLFKIFW